MSLQWDHPRCSSSFFEVSIIKIDSCLAEGLAVIGTKKFEASAVICARFIVLNVALRVPCEG